MSQIIALLGLIALVGSIFTNALMGQQIATIGVGFILLGIFLEIRKQRQ